MVAVSFEFFPPKNIRAEQDLWSAVEKLVVVEPDFVSVTYGAGGSTRARTHECVRTMVEKNLAVAAHLTCVGAPREEIEAVIADYAAIGVKHIVAIRGDMPDMGAFHAHPQGYQGSVELVAAIAAHNSFEISVSAYPEKHPQSASVEADIDLLKQKIEAGASRAITQFVFDMDVYLRFRDRLEAAGVDIPVIPAIMPTTNFAGVQRMAAQCGAAIPAWLATKFEGLEDDRSTQKEARKAVAEEVATAQCAQLIEAGAERIHFYTLNQADVTYNVCTRLGLGAGQ